MLFIRSLALFALCAAAGAHATPGVDAVAGKKLFVSNCAMCHSVSPDTAALAGPGLFNVLGRPVAGVPGFGYSKALAAAGASGKSWTFS